MQRTDMPWTATEPNPVFLQAIKDFPQKQRPLIVQMPEAFRESRNIITFKTRAEADTYAGEQNGGAPNV